MNHPVAVKRVIATERLMELVLGIAQVNAVNVRGDAPLNDNQFVRRHFLVQRCPCAVEIGVIAGAQR